MTATTHRTTVHRYPDPDGEVYPCCSQPVDDIPAADRLTRYDEDVTCIGQPDDGALPATPTTTKPLRDYREATMFAAIVLGRLAENLHPDHAVSVGITAFGEITFQMHDGDSTIPDAAALADRIGLPEHTVGLPFDDGREPHVWSGPVNGHHVRVVLHIRPS